MFKLFLLVVLLCPLNGFAKSTMIRFGIEPIKKSGSYSDVKVLSIGYENELKQNVYWKLETGYWADKRPGAKDAGFIAPSLGLVINPLFLKVKVYAGVAAISAKDDYLGGHFQFYEDVYLGLFEGRASIGLSLSHISSAGIYRPNKGRNFFTLTAHYEL